MKKAKPDPAKEAALQDALRIVQKIRQMPPDAQIVMKSLINLLYEAQLKSKAAKAKTTASEP